MRCRSHKQAASLMNTAKKTGCWLLSLPAASIQQGENNRFKKSTTSASVCKIKENIFWIYRSSSFFVDNEKNNFRGDLTDISATKYPLSTTISVLTIACAPLILCKSIHQIVHLKSFYFHRTNNDIYRLKVSPKDTIHLRGENR